MNKRFEMVPDPEMHAKPSRRRFGKDEILRILGEAECVKIFEPTFLKSTKIHGGPLSW